MKNIAVTIFIILIVAVMLLYFISFQVREIESALITTFGKPTRQITEPGWHFKWPAPIERVYKFDSRMRVFEADLGETTTKGAAPIIVNTYIVWKIAEPLVFFNAVGTIKEAENKLLSQLSDTQNKVIGGHDFADFVNSNPAKIKFEEIQNEMLADLQQPIRTDYGIEIKTLGIKQLKISEDVSKDVFERMRAERNRKTEATIAEGNAEAARIKTDADSKKTELLAAAEARAKTIRAEGDAEAAKYYKLLEEDPEFAMFLRDIDALKKYLENRSTVVFSADTQPFKLLKEMPDIKPRK
ncbi:MAG: protease modulator HflC [Sedimentisphaerales bacterium]|nr:protease modulator HflC [Sedimentisphaerales bacterium]